MNDIDHHALFKAFAQDIVKHANNILSNYTATLLQDYARDIDIYSFTKSRLGTFAEYLTVTRT